MNRTLIGRTDEIVADIEARYPPIGRFIDCDGLACHVLDEGAGHPVVLIHGASANLREWTASIFAFLAAKHRAIAIDRPGHGWSERPEDGGHLLSSQATILHQTLQQMDVERPVLVGHSFGGALILAYALAYPENVGGLLFMAGVSHPWPGGVGYQHQLAAFPGLGSLFIRRFAMPAFPRAAAGATARVFAPNTVPASYQERAAIELYRRPATFLANAEDLTHLKRAIIEMAPRYGEISAPLIALTGDKDSVIWTHLHTPPLVAKAKDARAIVLDGVGHMPHHARPGAVLDSIDELVARVSF